MKSFKLLGQVSLIILSSIFFSCSPSTTLHILKPADIMVSDEVQTIGTIDRSMPSSGWHNFIEGLLTGENIGQDKRGRHEAIAGFTDVLTQTPRFNVKAILTELTGSKTGASMAEPLSWDKIDQLCKEYQVDAIAAIEMFDSDLNYSRNKSDEKYKDKDGKERTRVNYSVDRRMEIRVGFRLYDNKSKTVADEFIVSANDSESASGDSRDKADRNLKNVDSQVRRIALNTGKIYAKRIAPLYITEERSFQRKVPTNKDAFEKALEAAKKENWTRAAEIWNTLATNSSDPKTAGRSCYNLAIACEAQGKLELALEWAEKSWKNYNLKAGRKYVNILKDRIADQKRVSEQMKSRSKT